MESPRDPFRLTPSDTLTPAGRARREAMLGALQDEVVAQAGWRRRRRKVVTRVISHVCALGVVAIVGMWLRGGGGGAAAPGPSGGQPVATSRGGGAPTPVEAVDPYRVAIIHTDSAAAQAMIVRSEGFDMSSYTIGDEDLLRALTAMGHPSGLVRVQGKVWLTNPIESEAPERPADAAG